MTDIISFLGFVLSIISIVIGGISLYKQMKENRQKQVLDTYRIFNEEATLLAEQLKHTSMNDKNYSSIILQKKIIDLYIAISKMAPISYDKNNFTQQRIVVANQLERIKTILELLGEINESLKKFDSDRLKSFINLNRSLRIKNGNYKYSYFTENLYQLLCDVEGLFENNKYKQAIVMLDSYFNCKEFMDELQVINDLCTPYFEALSSMEKETVNTQTSV